MRSAWLALLALPACDRGAHEPQAIARAQAAPSPGSDVVARNLARLDAELAAEKTPAEPAPADLAEHVLGLLETVRSARDSLRRLAADELVGLGAPAVPVLAATLADRSLEPDVRAAAAEMLGSIGSPEALEPLLAVLESSRTAVEREPALYAVCAVAVGRPAQAWVAPRLALCLKYETDHATVVRIADALSRVGLLCGLDALFVVAREGPDAGVRAEAEALLERLRTELGCADWQELAGLWNEGRLERLPPPPSGARYEREVWRTVARLGEWQLRGVDDARFTLLQLRETAATILAQALGDADVYVRLHSAQCLARMGPRGRAAEGALIAALDDPQVGATAAEALGRLGGEAAARALAERLQPAHPLELRTAAARALGSVAPPDVESVLAPWLGDDAPLDLATAAAEALLRSGLVQAGSAAEDAALRRAQAGLTSGLVEPSTCESALDAWLAARPEDAERLARWRALAERPVQERLAERAALLSTWRASAQSR